MTAAEKPTDNFLVDESNNLNLPLFEEDSDSVMENKDENISSDCGSEFPGSNRTQNSSDLVEEKTEISKTDEDEWLDIMGNGDFKKKIINKGQGQDTRPHRGDYVIVNIATYVNEKLVEEKENFKFVVGDLDVIQGVDLIVCLMEKGEKAKVIIPSKLAYGTVGLLPDVPPDSSVECDIELKEVETLDEDALTVSERLKLGDKKRKRGNFFYDCALYLDAIHCYERAADYLDGVRDGSNSSPAELQEIVDMRLKVYNNMAASHLKLNAYKSALKSVDAVLKVQPKNVKALFRKGKILAIQGTTDEAIACMKVAASLEPETKVIQQELTKLKSRKKREEATQKAMYQRMFKSEVKKESSPVSKFNRWSIISCGVLAVAIGSALAYKQYHT